MTFLISFLSVLRRTIGWNILASQIYRLKQVSKFNKLSATIIKFPRMMEEVVDF